VTIVGTAGHVDHGKSTLVRALTGTDPDRLAEERRRGLTIELGFAHTVLPSGATLSIVDVPGHVRFIANMLAGAGSVDAVLFVVAATEGWMPQSEEHLRILELLGVRRGIVVLTMADLVDDEWRELQQLDVADHLAGSFLADAPLVSVSAVTGQGIERLIEAIDAMLADEPPMDAASGLVAIDRPRLWIDRSFAIAGAGTVVTGSLTGGGLRVDETIDVVPQRRTARIRGLQVHGHAVPTAAAGTRVAVNLAGIDHDHVGRGDALVHVAQWRPTKRLDASLHVLETLGHVVSRRGAFTAFIGSGQYPVRVRILGAESIRPGGDGLVRLHLTTAVAVRPGDRFVVRESGRDETVGGGEVLDVAPIRPASKAAPDRRVQRVIDEHGWIAVDELAALTGEQRQPTAGIWVISDATLASVVERIESAVAGGGPAGVDVAMFDERQRAVLTTLEAFTVADGRVRRADAIDPLLEHPAVAALAAEGVAPSPPAGIERPDLRQLVRRGVLWERDGIFFHQRSIDLAIVAVQALATSHPDGFTVGDLRDALGVTRKFAVPIATELDSRGLTRRNGDLRTPGPRLPRNS